jgi:hypothetical protein
MMSRVGCCRWPCSDFVLGSDRLSTMSCELSSGSLVRRLGATAAALRQGLAAITHSALSLRSLWV